MHLDALIIREVTQIVFYSSLLTCAFQYQYDRVQSDHLLAYSIFLQINESQSKIAVMFYHRASLINNTIYVAGSDISIINHFYSRKPLPRKICVFAKMMMLYFVSD